MSKRHLIYLFVFFSSIIVTVLEVAHLKFPILKISNFAILFVICDTIIRFLLCSVYLILFKVDKKAMIRNRYNRIPHPAPPNGKGTRTTALKIKTTQVKIQRNVADTVY